MKKIIRKILKEDREQMFLDKIVQLMKNDFPFFKNLKEYGLYGNLSKDEIIYILKGILGAGLVNNFEIEFSFRKYIVYNINNDEIYVEFSDGDWYIPIYN